MNASEVLSELARQNIHIAVNGSNLSVTPPKDHTLAPELREQIKTNKQNIISILSTSLSQEPPPLVPTVRDSNIPQSFAQQRLWFISQFEEGNDTSYNLAWGLRLTGKLNIAALQLTFQTIVDRHESLRTTFQTVEGEAVQMIADSLTLDFPVIKVSEDEVPTYTDRNTAHVFNLTTGPLITVCLLKLASEEHILLINMHHIISDGWSGGVLTKEMTALYSAYAKGESSPLPPLPIQYADFSLWQRDWLQGGVLAQHVNYWKQQLDGAPALLELPTDQPRPAKQSYRGAIKKFQIPKALSDQVITLGRQERVTLFMLLMAVFQILLSRYSGQTDICVGTPIANRKQSALTDLIGFFVNTLVVRTQVDSQLSFKALLKQVRATTLASFRHQDLPFEQVIEALNPKRSLSHSPLFQVTLALGNIGNETLTLDNINISPVQGDIQTTQFDLTLFLSETDNGLTGGVMYDTDLFNSNTIKRFIQHYQILLEGIVENPEQRIFELPLLTPSERQQLLYDWNNTKIDYPQGKCFHELFEEQVEKTPDHVAIIYDKHQLSYMDLNSRANQLARYLRTKCVKPNSLVGICTDRSLEMVIGLLGILKAGGAYMPLDPNAPKARLNHMLKDAGVDILLTQNHLIKLLPLNDQQVICLDDISDLTHSNLQKQSIDNLEKDTLGLTENHLIYIIYTSGSTGTPKGVMLNHRSFVNHIQWMRYTFIFNTTDKILHKTPLSFDAAGWEWSLPLITGVPLIIARPEGHRDPAYLLELIYDHQITVLQVVPSLLTVLLEHDDCQKLKSLLHLFCGGEPLSLRLCNLFKEKKLPTSLYNLYGPTETTIDATFWSYNKQAENIPIGKPISNIQSYVINEHFYPVPTGVTGELCLSGKGLALGYLNRPELTAEKFIPNPFSNNFGDRMYKTGDLVRWSSDENLEYIRRIDHQVKIRGFRIELGDIEIQLLKIKWVEEAIVLVREDDPDNKKLVAYVIPSKQYKYFLDKNSCRDNEKNIPQTQDEPLSFIRNHLVNNLPEYMIPSAYVVLDKFPTTNNGKIDRKSLPVPDDTAIIQDTYVAPRTTKEKVVCDIWQEILNIESVGINDNFFDLGGNSLLTLKAISEIKNQLGIQLKVKDFYTDGAIGALIRLSEDNPKGNEIVNISEANLDDDIVPCGKLANDKFLKNIFLTGGSGFLGKYLLVELLRKTDATIYCLVRENAQEDGALRLKNSMADWNLWDSLYESRIVVVDGDLSLPRMGIEKNIYDKLSNNIDMIFHNATYMNHLDTYETMKEINVNGLKDIIKLACTKKQKIIQYISTTGVFTSPETDANTVSEYSSIDSQIHYKDHGYSSTKWVAEKLLMNAQDRGIPSNIYRLGLVTGDTRYGRSDSSQWFTRLLKIYTTLGCGFDDKGTKWLSITPVDCVSQSIVGLALKEFDNRVFHITNPQLLGFSDFISHYNRVTNNPLKIVPYEEFMALVRNYTGNGNSLPFVPFIHSRLFDNKDISFDVKNPLIVNSKETDKLLKEVGIDPLHIDQSTTSKYFEYIKKLIF